MRTLHLAALATYLGSCLQVILVVLPCAAVFTDPASQRRYLARAFRVQNPVAIAALGVLLMTGAFGLTDLKARMGPSFIQLSRALAIKLGLAFLVINVATYIAFGLAHRMVRAEQGKLPTDAAWQASVLRRLRGATATALVLTLLTIWLALEMRPILR